MKLFIRRACVCVLCIGLLCSNAIGTVYATDDSLLGLQSDALKEQELLDAYEELVCFIDRYDLPAEISLDVFRQNFEESGLTSVAEYVQQYYDWFDVSDQEAANARYSRSNWYYNTGTKLTVEPNYSKYNLLSKVQAGDIIYEAAGGFGITGHISIVEGIYFDSTYGRYYVRLIEAIGYSSGSGQGDGVCRGVLDDDRLDAREGTVLRVSGASVTVISNAIAFCRSQIGTAYALDFVKDTSASELDWYCSELVWAAYFNQGVNIENDTIPSGVTPHEILDANNVSAVTVTSVGTPQNVRLSMGSSNNVSITWSAVSGASSYYIYSASSASGTYSLVTYVTSPSYTYYLAEGATAYFRIIAQVNGITGNYSDPVGIKNDFSAPSILYINSPSSTSVELTWNAVKNATSYRVYRAVGSSNNFTLIATTTLPTYTDTTCATGTTYYYKVSALNGNVETAYSGTRSKKVTELLTPQIYYAGEYQEPFGMIIKWTYIPGATMYNIYYTDNLYQPSYSLLGTSQMTSFVFEAAVDSKTYCFKVVACSSGGNSDYSDVFSGAV